MSFKIRINKIFEDGYYYLNMLECDNLILDRGLYRFYITIGGIKNKIYIYLNETKIRCDKNKIIKLKEESNIYFFSNKNIDINSYKVYLCVDKLLICENLYHQE